jgi:hypothetical protein
MIIIAILDFQLKEEYLLLSFYYFLFMPLMFINSVTNLAGNGYSKRQLRG